MKLQTTKNAYTACNGNNYVELSPDCKKVTAWSYDWWTYIATDSVGNIYFQDYSYSVNTSKHQSNASYVLRNLGLNISLSVNTTNDHFGDGSDESIKRLINSEIKAIRYDIYDLIKATRVKGSWKKKNAERRASVGAKLYRIKDLRNYRDNYVGKKLIPIKQDKLLKVSKFLKANKYELKCDQFYLDLKAAPDKRAFFKERRLASGKYFCNWRKCERYNFTDSFSDWFTDKYGDGTRYHTFKRDTYFGLDRKKVLVFNRLKQYFKKPSGKIDLNSLRQVLDSYDSYRALDRVPESLDKLKSILGMKASDSVITLLNYRHVRDVINMLPDQDSDEEKQLKRWLKRMGINRETINLLNLDKLHTYQISKLNRKNYVASEPNYFPVHPTIKALEGTEGLSLIEHDRALRAEGRKQGHCIGGRYYQQGCKRGYQALNFKGYTFYLTPTLDISQTNGKHNSYTPDKIRRELITLIKGASTTASVATQGA